MNRGNRLALALNKSILFRTVEIADSEFVKLELTYDELGEKTVQLVRILKLIREKTV